MVLEFSEQDHPEPAAVMTQFADRAATFTALHQKIKNGPVTFPKIIDGLTPYVKGRGSSITTSLSGSWSGIKAALDKDRMVVILLAAGLVGWHFVNAVGYRKYSNGANYIRVRDGWHQTVERWIHSSNLVGSYVMHVT